MRFSTMVEIANTLKIESPGNSLISLRDYFLVTQQMKDLESVLRKFLTAQKLLHSEEVLTRLAFEACEDAFNDGVRVVELRYAPSFIADGHSHLSFEKIHLALLKGLAMAEAKFPIATGLICIAQRIKSLRVANEVIDFVIDHKDSFIAVDLADNEENFDPKPFANIFSKAKKAGLHITIHSGEAPNEKSARWVKDSIELLEAERIGHGIQIIQNLDVLNFVREKNIPLEVCPISNWLTQSFATYEAHPIRKLINAGILVTINSDDPGIFGTSLSDDYEVLHRVHNFTRADFARANEVAIAKSFIAKSKIQKVWAT